ncbi:hypothetical protein STANM309S_05274 [Streptomyces tanashiensis]
MSLAAHSMPAMICDSVPEPWSLRTLPTARVAPGATPFSLPSLAAPDPPTVEVTWVPWPPRSATSWPSMKDLVSAIRPARSGWPRSAPVSRTATLTPLPVSPASQAFGVPIWALDSAMAALTRPSSQTLPGAAARAVPRAVKPCQKAAGSVAVTAAPPMLGRARTVSAPRGAAAVRAPLAP